MPSQSLSVRLAEEEAALLARLCSKTGLSKSAAVKYALREMAAQLGPEADASLYSLGIARFGRYGDATRQSADIKRFVRSRFSRQSKSRA